MFTSIWGRFSFWLILIFFKWVETCWNHQPAWSQWYVGRGDGIFVANFGAKKETQSTNRPVKRWEGQGFSSYKKMYSSLKPLKFSPWTMNLLLWNISGIGAQQKWTKGSPTLVPLTVTTSLQHRPPALAPRQKFLYFASALAGTIGFQTGAFSWSSR